MKVRQKSFTQQKNIIRFIENTVLNANANICSALFQVLLILFIVVAERHSFLKKFATNTSEMLHLHEIIVRRIWFMLLYVIRPQKIWAWLSNKFESEAASEVLKSDSEVSWMKWKNVLWNT